MTIISKNKSLNLQSVTQEVYDVTGAGDTVIAAVFNLSSYRKRYI